MTKQYEDKVNRTFELYSAQILYALRQLQSKNETYVEVSIGKNGITGFFKDIKKLEAKVQELTGDPDARLIRAGQGEYCDLARIFSPERQPLQFKNYVGVFPNIFLGQRKTKIKL